jgi:hypothetical protein
VARTLTEPCGELDGVEMRDGRLHIAPVRASAPTDALALAGTVEALMPTARITEVLHDVARATGFMAAFTNLRTGESCENESALLAAVLADATNLGLGRMAAASQGITRDRLIWTADAYIRSATYQAALARIINAHHGSPPSGATAPRPPPTGSSSARRGAGTPPGTSMPAMAPIRASAFTPTSPISKGPTAHASCRPPATRPRMCLMDCFTTARRCGSIRPS